HAFGEDNELALHFIVFMASILVVSIGLIVYRSNKLSSRLEFESFFSREFSFLINNWILLGCAFFVLFATMFPTISEALDGSRVSVGIDFFNKWMTPLGLTLLLLAGAATLLAWRKTSLQRLSQQFLFPTLLMALTIAALVALGKSGVLPRVIIDTPIFADAIKLPISIVNFGLCAFVFGSILQELYRGAAVRRRQTGSDPFTSLLGLVLSKRRKYGGYVVHLGVAVMFVGFAGKAYDRMDDRTLAKPAIAVGLDKNRPAAEREQWAQQHLAQDMTMRDLVPDPQSSFTFAGYVFQYENLTETTDDLKTAVTAQVSIWMGDERIGTVYPAKWDYHKEEGQMTTEVAIKVRVAEDVYMVLTGFDLESKQANFRVYINPLILWVWVGFLILAFGTLVCLIPQRVVDLMQWKPKTKLGRAADVSIVAGVCVALVLGLASQAHAAAPQESGGEHVPAGMGMGQAGGGYAAQNRPTNGTAEKAMKELICPCGCARQDIHNCDCKTAADLRGKVIGILAGFDLNTPNGRKQGYDKVMQVFVAEYSESVLATPRSKFPWLLPSLAAIGALGLLIVAGRRWIAKGKADLAARPAPTTTTADDAFVDKLDDELAETD
ncbi:MAG TPA: cytochrome c-type biogenesis CcmF C-terminal domain-containing protein, partial [Kofleriaceae bacterium]